MHVVLFLMLAYCAILVAGAPRWHVGCATVAKHSGGAPVSLVINLGFNTGRMRTFVQAYAQSDLATSRLLRVEAVDGKKVDWSRYLTSEALEQLMTMHQTGYRLRHPDLTPGAVGCYLSHLRAWGIVRAAKVPYAFVFEDDARVSPTCAQTFERALPNMPWGWDIVLLGDSGSTDEEVVPGVARVGTFLGMFAYAISQAGVRKLLGCMMPIQQQIDWEVSRQIKVSGIKVFALRPPVAQVEWQGTDIQSPLKEGFSS